jgi:NAD(P)-dependent dehydrogenase (short-subunit alcohol dehydrogenase family)
MSKDGDGGAGKPRYSCRQCYTKANRLLGPISEERFGRTFNTNAKGVLFSVQPALALLPRGGTIVIVGAMASISPTPVDAKPSCCTGPGCLKIGADYLNPQKLRKLA